jgi:hypothetical protein
MADSTLFDGPDDRQWESDRALVGQESIDREADDQWVPG